MVASTAGRAARLAASRAGAALPKTAAAPRQVAGRSHSTWSSSSSSSSASSSRATRATLAFAGASSILALALSSNKAPLRADSSSTTSPPQKRQTFGDRLRANRGGNISIPRPAEAEEAEEEEEEVAEVVDEGVETIAQIVAEDAPLEDESQQSAYDPSTGQINWDCPCLGGMAHGPCGDQFKDAFSCFVYSEQEPKGIECVEKFKAMQDCFRAHPEVYREELEQEERDEMESLVSEAETALGIERKATLEGVASAE